MTWAAKELKSYQQVLIGAGESATVNLELPASFCTLVTADGHRVVEPGEFELLGGPSSRTTDLLRATFRIGVGSPAPGSRESGAWPGGDQ